MLGRVPFEITSHAHVLGFMLRCVKLDLQPFESYRGHIAVLPGRVSQRAEAHALVDEK